MAKHKNEYDPSPYDIPRTISPAQRPQLNETVTGTRCGCACNVGDGGEQRGDNRNNVERVQEIAAAALPGLEMEYEFTHGDGIPESVPFIFNDDLILRLQMDAQMSVQMPTYYTQTRCGAYCLGPHGFRVQDKDDQDGGPGMHPIQVGKVFEGRSTPDSMENERGTSGVVSLGSSGLLAQRSESPGQLVAYVGSWVDDPLAPEVVGFADERGPARRQHPEYLMDDALEED